MSLSTYALVSVAELKPILGIDLAQTGQDSTLEGIINRASEVIDTYLARQVVTRGSRTEYHSLAVPCDVLSLLEFPITTLTSVAEGAWISGTWTADETLTENTDFVKDVAAGHLVRLSSHWKLGRESVKVVYVPGYATTAAVPGPLKEVCLALAARKYSQIKRGGDFGAQTVSDAIGSVTRFLPGELLRMEQEALYTWRSPNFAPTGRVA